MSRETGCWMKYSSAAWFCESIEAAIFAIDIVKFELPAEETCERFEG
jgi:hypothetical protein